MTWLRLTFECGPAQVDAASELLERFGADAVSVLPAEGARFADAPGEDPYWPSNRISTLLEAGTDLDILLACLKNRIGPENIRHPAVEPVGDRDWTAASRAACEPLRFGERLCVCPGWAEPPAGVPVLRLDPGLAFGTGSHATTALCLEWLAREELRGRDVIDYGCGSGILALAAALLGARSVQALDIDPEAVAVASANAAQNGLERRVRFSVCGEAVPARADILVANILLRPLVELAPTFSALVNPGGQLVLSGILATQTDECAAAYRAWFDFAPPQFRDEWALLRGVRNRGTSGRAAPPPKGA